MISNIDGLDILFMILLIIHLAIYTINKFDN